MDRLQKMLDSLTDSFEALSPRDRMLATGLVVFVALLLAGGFTYALKSRVDDAASRVRAAKENLEEVNAMVGEYSVLRARLDAAEARMTSFRVSQMNTYLEGWATNAGVQPQMRIQPVGEPMVVGNFREQAVRVTLDDVLLDNIIRFVYAIETSRYPIKVRSSKFRANDRRGERTLDLDLELVAYTRDQP